MCVSEVCAPYTHLPAKSIQTKAGQLCHCYAPIQCWAACTAQPHWEALGACHASRGMNGFMSSGAPRAYWLLSGALTPRISHRRNERGCSRRVCAPTEACHVCRCRTRSRSRRSSVDMGSRSRRSSVDMGRRRSFSLASPPIDLMEALPAVSGWYEESCLSDCSDSVAPLGPLHLDSLTPGDDEGRYCDHKALLSKFPVAMACVPGLDSEDNTAHENLARTSLPAVEHQNIAVQIKTEAGEHVAAAASADFEEEANLHGEGFVQEGEGVESTASFIPKEAKTEKKAKKPAARRKHWQPGARPVLRPSPALTQLPGFRLPEC